MGMYMNYIHDFHKPFPNENETTKKGIKRRNVYIRRTKLCPFFYLQLSRSTNWVFHAAKEMRRKDKI